MNILRVLLGSQSIDPGSFEGRFIGIARMRKPRPIVSDLDEILIIRAGDVATIAYRDSAYGTTHLKIGPEISRMTDQTIMDLYNETLRSQSELAAMNPHVAVEVPLNSPQIEYHENADQWAPRGDVVRCRIGDAEGGREPVIEVDGRELSLEEFGGLLCTYAGWGMRIEFVPEDEIHRRSKLVVRDPER